MINRRKLLRYGQMGLLGALSTSLTSSWQTSQAQTPTTNNSLSVKWLGHTCFLFTGNGQKVLVNPFRTRGCTAGYRPPQVEADLVLISSRLLDEGATDQLLGNPQLLFEPGAYQFRGKQIQGIRTYHDRFGGLRFGINVAWSWTQAGIKILHLGGAAAPITTEQQILMGRPDLLLLPVGGGPKAYNPEEAKQAIQALNPKVVIPSHYLTQAATEGTCDLVSVDEFLSLMEDTTIERVNNDSITLTPESLPTSDQVIKVLSYKF